MGFFTEPVGTKYEIDTCSYAVAIQVFSIPDCLPSQRGTLMDKVSCYICDFDVGLLNQPGNCNRSVPCFPDGVWVYINIGIGILSCYGISRIGYQTLAGTYVDYA